MEYNSPYKEWKCKKDRGSAGEKKEKTEKEFTCVYAYNNGQCEEKVYRACGVWGCRMIDRELDERPQ